MKICAIGDPHGDMKKIKKIPLKDVDLILMNGDVGKADFARERAFENLRRKNKGLKELKFTAKDIKMIIRENHDSSLEIWEYTSKLASTYSIFGNFAMTTSLRSNMNKIRNFHFVKNRVRKIEGLRIGFLEYFQDICWCREYNNTDKKIIAKAKKETAKAKKILKNFKKIDILVCHQPPFGYLDETNHPSAPKEWKGKHAGSKVILDYIKKEQPKYVFCGHIHESEGKAKIGKSEIYNLGIVGHKIVEV